MVGGNHHGVLGDPQKGSLVKHLCGNAGSNRSHELNYERMYFSLGF